MRSLSASITENPIMARLNKTELAREVAQESGLESGQSKLALEKTFELIARHLQAGDEVELAGFGKFTLSDRAARQGRNPSTGETIQIPASRAAKFSASSALKNAVRG
jgi:DNA-binding protein HU-beta